MRGRRRIGKSTLIREFAKRYDNVIEIQGLPPNEANSNQKQLKHFADELAQRAKMPQFDLQDWSEAFRALAKLTNKGKFLIFLDEISWMGKYDSDFAGKLKIAWDTEFKINSNLILIICGSVSTWIQKNILNNTGFVGRISLNIKLSDLSIEHSIEMLKGQSLSEYEQVKILSLTGGVPKYLEEINIKETAEQNMERLLLNKSGFLFNEFTQIFNQIFEKRAPKLQSILIQLSQGANRAKDLAKANNVPLNGDFFEDLEHLCESGFVAKNTTWSINTTKDSNLSQYRISDNFIYFYLKFIFPIKGRIEKFPLKISSLKNWESIVGYQFQNIIYNSYQILLKELKISEDELIQIGPFFQRKNSKQKGCQIDLLIQTKFGNLYVCEIKSQPYIGASIVSELHEKIKKLNYRKGFTVRPVLIVCGEVSDKVLSSEDIFKIVSFNDLSKKRS